MDDPRRFRVGTLMILRPEVTGWRARICDWIGHDATTAVSPLLESHLGGDHWSWPAAVSYCPRCGLIYRLAGLNGPARFRDHSTGVEFTMLDTKAGLKGTA